MFGGQTCFKGIMNGRLTKRAQPFAASPSNYLSSYSQTAGICPIQLLFTLTASHPARKICKSIFFSLLQTQTVFFLWSPECINSTIMFSSIIILY